MISVHALVNCTSSSDDDPDKFKFIVIEDRNQNFRLGEGDNNKETIDSFSIPSPPEGPRTSLPGRIVLRRTPEFVTTGEGLYCISGQSNTHLYCINDIHITDYPVWRRCNSLNVPKISPRLFAYNNMLYAFEAEFDFDHPPPKEGDSWLEVYDIRADNWTQYDLHFASNFKCKSLPRLIYWCTPIPHLNMLVFYAYDEDHHGLFSCDLSNMKVDHFDLTFIVKLDEISSEPTNIVLQPAHHGNYLYILGARFRLFSYCLESRNWSVVDGFDLRQLSNYYPTSDTSFVEIVPLGNNKGFGATLFDPSSLTLYWTKFFISNPPQSITDSPMAFNFTTPQISQFPWLPHPLFVIEHAKAACREHAKKRTISTAIQEKMKTFTDRKENLTILPMPLMSHRELELEKHKFIEGGKLDLSLKQEEEIKSLKGVIKSVNSLSLDLNQTKQLQCLYEDLAELEDECLKHTKEKELLKSTGGFVNPPQLSEFMEKQGGKQSSSYLKKDKKAIHEKRYTWIPTNIAKSRIPTQWSLYLKSLSLGAALTALHVWINDLSKAVENGEELPPVFGINTGHENHKFSDKGFAGMFESHLKELSAPFHEVPDKVGWFLTTKEAAKSWFLTTVFRYAIIKL
ncbi:hypothetical protein ACFE04_010952 [Oxalis oulophora]